MNIDNAAVSTEPQQQQQQQEGNQDNNEQQLANNDSTNPPSSAAKRIEWYKRTQIVIPVSSSTKQLTPRLLQRFFGIRGVAAQQLILALVDSNGVPTQNVLYNYIQAPLEGPGMADLELLDD